MKRNKLIRFLSDNGCVLYREGGSHSVFMNTGNLKKVAVPRHPDINDYLVKEICKELGIPYPGKN